MKATLRAILNQFLCILFVSALLSLSMPAFAQPGAAKKSNPARTSKKIAEKNLADIEAQNLLVKSFEVSGNRKIEKDAILAKMVSKVGGPYSAELVRQDVEALFKLGYFNDIEVSRAVSGSEVQLTFKVVEKPSISEIVYEGQSEIKAEDLTEASGLKAYQLLDMTKVRDAVEKLQKLYEDKGFFLARVESKVETNGENVKVTFRIHENDKVKVKKITLLGNKHLSDSDIKGKLLTQEGGFFSAMSGSGQYKQEMFERDVQILRFLYWNQGYVQAKVDRPQVTVTPDKKNIYITIHIEEGEQFDVGEVDFAGDILFPRQELFDAIKIDENGVFAYDVLQKDISELTAKYGDLGYAYANVIPRTAFNAKERKVNLVFEFDKGSKVYFGRINVVGNSKTRDKVVRRELKIREGELYNETRRRQSVENVQRLGFFDEVNFKTSVDGEKSDVMNIDIAIKERNTGQIQLGAGYGSSQGFTLQGSVNQANFLGRGQNLGASLNLSGNSSRYSFTFLEPYFLDSLWSVQTDIYQSSDTGRSDYNESHRGAALRLGHPIAEYTRGYLRYKYDDTSLESKEDSYGEGRGTDQDLFPLASASGITSSLMGSVEFDTRNDRQMPSKGLFSSLSYEYAGLGGDLKYTRANGNFRFYKNLFWDVVWRNNMEYARIEGLEGKEVPFSELYLLGGPYSLRGYRSYRVGRMKFSQKIYDYLISEKNYSPERAQIEAMRFFGGTQMAKYQTELQFPLVKEAGIMAAGFFDIGAADDELTDRNFYADVGFGIRWYSPIGVLRFEWGFPLNRDSEYQDATVFEFSIGPSF